MIANRDFYIFIILAVLFILASSLKVPLVVNAAKYAEVSREIILNKDWINLSIAGDAYGQKPPMLFWVGALSYSIFGFSVIAYKIAVMLLSLIGLYSVFRLGSLMYNKKAGRLAVVFWGTSLAFLHFNNDIHTDTLLASFVVFAVWQFMAFLRLRKWHHFLLGSVGVGLSMLTKGPVGMLIPSAVIGAEMLIQRQWKDFFSWRWLLALAVVAVIISPAMIGLLNQFGIEGLKFYFWTNNVGRVTGSYKGTSADYTFYLHTSLYLLLPWSVFMLIALFKEIQQAFRSKLRKTEANFSILAGIIFFVAILSVAKQQNPHYILSAVPFIFIITAKWTIILFEKNSNIFFQKTLAILHKFIAVILVAFLLLITLYVYPEKHVFYWVVYVLLFIGVLFFVFQRLNLQKQILMLVVAASAVLFTINTSMYPGMMQYHTSYDAAEVFNQEAPDGVTLSIYSESARYWNLFLYSKSPGRYLLNTGDLQKLKTQKGEWVYTSESGYKELEKAGIKFEVEKVYPQHRSLTRQSLRFLNPKTRASRFEKMYLIVLG